MLPARTPSSLSLPAPPASSGCEDVMNDTPVVNGFLEMNPYKLSSLRGRQKESKERKELRKFIKRKTSRYIDLNRSLASQGAIIKAITSAINKRYPDANYTFEDTTLDVSRQRRLLREAQGLVKRRSSAASSKAFPPSSSSIRVKKKWSGPLPLRRNVEPLLLKPVIPPSRWDIDLIVARSISASSHPARDSHPDPFSWHPDPIDQWLVEKSIV